MVTLWKKYMKDYLLNLLSYLALRIYATPMETVLETLQTQMPPRMKTETAPNDQQLETKSWRNLGESASVMKSSD